jgi:hypothetical protein
VLLSVVNLAEHLPELREELAGLLDGSGIHNNESEDCSGPINFHADNKYALEFSGNVSGDALHPVTLIRPPNGSRDVERWTGTEWIADDGLPGLCFSGKDSNGMFGFPVAWYPKCERDGVGKDCIHTIAMNRTVDRYSCANGREV